jgi:hypothetical protein
VYERPWASVTENDAAEPIDTELRRSPTRTRMVALGTVATAVPG